MISKSWSLEYEKLAHKVVANKVVKMKTKMHFLMFFICNQTTD